jgi:hypothetical protein
MQHSPIPSLGLNPAQLSAGSAPWIYIADST